MEQARTEPWDYKMGIDLSQSYLVGDAVSDLLAGHRVGCQLFLVLTGRGWRELVPVLRSVHYSPITRSLSAAAIHIFAAEAALACEGSVVAQAVSPYGVRAGRDATSKSGRGGQI